MIDSEKWPPELFNADELAAVEAGDFGEHINDDGSTFSLINMAKVVIWRDTQGKITRLYRWDDELGCHLEQPV